MGKRQQASEGIQRDLETPDGILPSQAEKPEVEEEEDEDEEQPEKLNRRACANRVVKEWLASNNGDTTLDELAEKADKLFMAGHPKAEEDVERAAWDVQAVLQQLEELELLKLEWHCGVSPCCRMNSK